MISLLLQSCSLLAYFYYIMMPFSTQAQVFK